MLESLVQAGHQPHRIGPGQREFGPEGQARNARTSSGQSEAKEELHSQDAKSPGGKGHANQRGNPQVMMKDPGNLAPGDVVSGLEAYGLVQIQRLQQDAGRRSRASVPPDGGASARRRGTRGPRQGSWPATCVRWRRQALAS